MEQLEAQAQQGEAATEVRPEIAEPATEPWKPAGISDRRRTLLGECVLHARIDAAAQFGHVSLAQKPYPGHMPNYSAYNAAKNAVTASSALIVRLIDIWLPADAEYSAWKNLWVL